MPTGSLPLGWGVPGVTPQTPGLHRPPGGLSSAAEAGGSHARAPGPGTCPLTSEAGSGGATLGPEARGSRAALEKRGQGLRQLMPAPLTSFSTCRPPPAGSGLPRLGTWLLWPQPAARSPHAAQATSLLMVFLLLTAYVGRYRDTREVCWDCLLGAIWGSAVTVLKGRAQLTLGREEKATQAGVGVVRAWRPGRWRCLQSLIGAPCAPPPDNVPSPV